MMNWTKNGLTVLIDWKLFSWLSRFNLLINRPSQLQLEFPLLTLHLQLSAKIPSRSFNHFHQGALAQTPLYLYISQPASPSRMLLLSALEKTSLLISICHPASLYPTNRLSDLLHHQSALAMTRLRNISQPASLSRTDTGQGPLHLGALAEIPLSLDIIQPASLTPTGTDLPLMLVPTLLPSDLQKAKSGPTDLNLLWPPTPALLLCVDRDRIVLLVGALLLVRITLTDNLSTYTQKRESYQKIRSVLLLSLTKPLVKNRLIGRP